MRAISPQLTAIQNHLPLQIRTITMHGAITDEALPPQVIRQYQMMLPEVSPGSLGLIREIIRANLRLWRKPDLAFAAELGVTELLTNVYRHTNGGCELLVRETPGGILISVTDFDTHLPAIKEPDEIGDGGRGLFLLAHLTTDLAIAPLPQGKQIWFRLYDATEDEAGK